MHALSGKEVEGQEFELEIPFKNTMGSGLLPDHLKGPGIKITSISTDVPFQILSTEPKTPISVDYLSSLVFRVRLRSPTTNYTGPVTISFNTESGDNVNIDLNKVVLVDGTLRVDIEDTASNMILKKSQIIRIP